MMGNNDFPIKVETARMTAEQNEKKRDSPTNQYDTFMEVSATLAPEIASSIDRLMSWKWEEILLPEDYVKEIKSRTKNIDERVLEYVEKKVQILPLIFDKPPEDKDTHLANMILNDADYQVTTDIHPVIGNAIVKYNLSKINQFFDLHFRISQFLSHNDYSEFKIDNFPTPEKYHITIKESYSVLDNIQKNRQELQNGRGETIRIRKIYTRLLKDITSNLEEYKDNSIKFYHSLLFAVDNGSDNLWFWNKNKIDQKKREAIYKCGNKRENAEKYTPQLYTLPKNVFPKISKITKDLKSSDEEMIIICKDIPEQISNKTSDVKEYLTRIEPTIKTALSFRTDAISAYNNALTLLNSPLVQELDKSRRDLFDRIKTLTEERRELHIRLDGLLNYLINPRDYSGEDKEKERLGIFLQNRDSVYNPSNYLAKFNEWRTQKAMEIVNGIGRNEGER